MQRQRHWWLRLRSDWRYQTSQCFGVSSANISSSRKTLVLNLLSKCRTAGLQAPPPTSATGCSLFSALFPSLSFLIVARAFQGFQPEISDVSLFPNDVDVEVRRSQHAPQP